MSEPIDLAALRAAAEEANHPGSQYADVLAMFDHLGPTTVLALIDAVEAAQHLSRDFTDMGDALGAQQRLETALAKFTTNTST